VLQECRSAPDLAPANPKYRSAPAYWQPRISISGED
jgi:hypothetical protein